jgi:translation elongation factor EF-1alpha
MIKVGDIVRLNVKNDMFHDAKGLVIQRVDAPDHMVDGYYFRILLFDGHLIIGLPDEIELLENEMEI